MRHIMKAGVVLAALAFVGCNRVREVPVGFSDRIMLDHKIFGVDQVASPDGKAGFSKISVLADVDAIGRVTRAWSVPSRADQHVDKRPAIKAARTWRFRPFTFHGKVVPARVWISIYYTAKERWSARPIPVPKLSDRNFAITLRRSACYGNCPDYQVTIAGDGTVTFDSRYAPIDPVAGLHREHYPGGIVVPGSHLTRISTAEVDALVEHFRASGFFAAEPVYSYNATDNPTYELRFAWGHQYFEITDYIGLQAGMPKAIRDLEAEVDRVAGTDRWISGTADTVRALKSENFDFASAAARSILFDASQSEDPSTRAFAIDLAKLVPLGEPVGPDRMALGTMVALNAAWAGNRDLFVLMRSVGWTKNLSKSNLSKAFANSLGGCDAAFARELIEAGADPNARPDTPIGGMATLEAVDGQYGPCKGKSSADRIAFAKALIALGANVNARNGYGQTAIFNAEDPEFAQFLIDAGAKLDIRDEDGILPILSSLDDAVVLTMLEAGARVAPTDKDDQGHTLRRRAVEWNNPATLAWLDAHHFP